jgi:AsmA protein
MVRRVALIAGIVVVLLFAAAVIVPAVIGANRFRPELESTLSAAFGRPVTIGHLSLSVLSRNVTADGITIANSPGFGPTPFLRAKSLKAGFELWPLIFSRKLNIKELIIEQPEVILAQNSSGRWNYSNPRTSRPQQAAPAPPSPGGKESINITAKDVKVVNGRLVMASTRGTQTSLDQVNLEIRDFSPASRFPFSLSARTAGGGELKLHGNAGPLDTANPAQTPLSTSVDLARLDLRRTLGTAAPNIAGVVALRGDAQSAGGRMTLAGAMQVDGLKLTRNGSPARKPVLATFDIVGDLRTHAATIERGDIRTGAAAASLTGSLLQAGHAIVLDLRLAGRHMPVPDIAGLLPAFGITLPAGSSLQGGFADAALIVKGPASSPVTSGSVAVNNTRLANFDLGTKMALAETLAGISPSRDTDIQTLSADVQSGPAGTALRNIHLVVPAIGEFDGSGTISPPGRLDFRMNAFIRSSTLAALGHFPVPFLIQGTTQNPVFKPDVQALARAQSRAMIQSQKGLNGNAGQAIANALDQILRAGQGK